MSLQEKSACVKQLALKQGFDLAGIASTSNPPKEINRLTDSIAQGHLDPFPWIGRQKEKRLDPSKVLSKAKSIICVALSYNTDKPHSIDLKTQPWISRYAWGDDYHDVVGQKLQAFEEDLKTAFPEIEESKSFVDSGPVAEKPWALSAGLGFFGKNTLLINKEFGSMFFLGVLLCDLELEPDKRSENLCGSCQRCLEACPTKALTAPGQLDARLCLSAQTIESRGEIPATLHKLLGANLYGCDICQDVCPYNENAPVSKTRAFTAREHNWNPDLDAIENMTEQEFTALYQKSPIKRLKLENLKRNAKIVAKNLKL